jgi:hypothetical protein
MGGARGQVSTFARIDGIEGPEYPGVYCVIFMSESAYFDMGNLDMVRYWRAEMIVLPHTAMEEVRCPSEVLTGLHLLLNRP